MKKVLLSNGIFNVTNSLYESIKKNNPELLMEDNSDNIFSYVYKYKEITGKEDLRDSDYEYINKIKEEVKNQLRNEKKDDEFSNEKFAKILNNKIEDDVLKIVNDKNNFSDKDRLNIGEKKYEYIDEYKELLKQNEGDKEKTKEEFIDKLNNVIENNTDSSNNNPFNVNSSSQRNIWSGENDTQKNQFSEDNYRKRLDILFKNQITNKSIKFIKNLKDKTISKDKKDCIEEILEKLNNIENYEENESKNRLEYIILAIFLNISTNVNDTSNEYNFNNLYEKAINEKNNIIYFMSDDEWNNFDNTLVLKNINVDEKKLKELEKEEEKLKKKEQESGLSDDEKKQLEKIENQKQEMENQKSNNKNIKEQFVDEFKKIKDYSFNSEIPKVIIDYYKAIYKNLQGKVLRTGFPKTFKDIKNTNDSELDKFWEKAGKIAQGITPGAVEFTPFRALRGWGPKSAYFAKYLRYIYVNFLKKYSMEKFHEQLSYKGINLIEFYKNIQPTFYLRNACMINCRTQKATNLVISTIDKLRIERNDVNVRKEVLATGFNTTNIVYLIYVDDETNDLIYNKEEDMLLKKIKNVYFIIVTEGFVRKGELLKKAFNKSKDLLSTKGNKLFGMDMNVSSSGK